MRKAKLWALLWILFVSGLQAADELTEEKYHLREGETLEVQCPFNIQMYLYSQKAWQRLQSGTEPLTLAHTQSTSGEHSVVQVGRYRLEDDPREAMLHVQVTNLQAEDSGLYRCVIYQPPKDPLLLFYPVRLVVTKDPSGTPSSNESLSPIPTVPPSPPIKVLRGTLTTPRPENQPPLQPTTVPVSTPDPRANLTDVRHVSRTSVLPIGLCALLNKSLVFAVLFTVARR
ncbi:triggering receptor expressed on myeloid cells 1 [Dasypus novemcinctus]|uniref:triggering receptor expressed on myeloid cells 1 n=1 Tax=Dasypus novemcinctus TaxID=9361 RepID=UPI00265F6F6C|nr:triggering receptor expressed on myeloid cells 1 [Dasypus novemcinctus]